MRGAEFIHVWAPGIREGAGGIQAFSRVYVQALCEAYPWARVRVFVKNDEPKPDDPLHRLGVVFHSMAPYPMWARTLMLVIFGLGMGLWERPACVVTTHLHFLPALCWLKWLRRVPIMSVLHGIEAWGLRGGARMRALKAADHLLAVSRHTRTQVISYGIDPGKVSVVPNTFDEDRFVPGPKPAHLLRRYGLRPEQRVLLTVSRLACAERYKGHRQVLEALEGVKKNHPDLRYLIVGSGDDLQEVRNEAHARGLNEMVIFAGHVNGDELPDHYRLCDVFVMPSSKEGFGIVFLEAMACGKPVVAGNVDGSVDALDDGRLGRLVDPYDTAEIAVAIEEMLQHRPLNALWHDPAALRRAVVAQFSYSRVGPLLAEDLLALLGRKGSHAQGRGIGMRSKEAIQKPHVVVLTQLTSPYQVEFFNALAASQSCHLTVVYLTSRDRKRHWATPLITHPHWILSETPQLRGDARWALLCADLAVFNYYTDWFALSVIRERARTGRPWVFWGERPGFLQTGLLGEVARRFLLNPLHRQPVPIWGVGHFGMEGYQREFGRHHSYENIPYFSNLERFFAIPRAEDARRVFFYSGAMSYRKGTDLLAVAFARVAARHPHAHLVLLGRGDMEQQMRNTLQPWAGQVTWLGFKPWKDLPECYAQGTVFCFPSRYDGWGLALVEAMAAGMPAIGTSRTGSAVEFLTDKERGWLVEAGSAHALEEAMENALSLSRHRFAHMQRAARKAVVAEHLPQGVQRFTAAASRALAQWRRETPADAATV